MFFRFLLKRLGQTLIVLLCVTVIAFALIHIAPGSPARIVLGDSATDEMVAAMEEKMGLNKPLYAQYFDYLLGILKGDLGTSTTYQQPAAKLIFSRFPNTLLLTIVTTIICLLISIPLGIIAGVNQGKPIDFIAMVFAILGQSMSTVWLAVLNIYIFSVKLGWLPTIGMGGWEFIILPALTLGYPISAQVTRLGRSGMIDVLREDYITATLAKGISSRKVYTKYAFKNALIPIITIVGMQIGVFLGGAVVVETVFSWSGIGQLTNQAVGNRDYALVQSLLLVTAVCFAVINLLIDIINAKIDPRITLE